MDAIRGYRPGDEKDIAEIFVRAIHEVARAFYSEEQCLAWSDKEPNVEHWRERCAWKRPWISVMDGRVAGFLELDADGHIDCAYTHPKFQRRGVISGLVRHAEQIAMEAGLERLYVEASLVARPMFEKLGFVVLAENLAERKGITLINYRMQKPLT
jgi:putative acetyltransferase